MYKHYFGLSEAPFSIAPDPRYLYMSERHREALAHLMYGIDRDGGFVLLTGEIGTGKTTVCRCFLQQIPKNCDVAFIFNPKLSVEELLSTICDELRISYPKGQHGTAKLFVDRINAHLLAAHAQGRNTVLIIDEAQNLGADVLEQIRLLTNLETNQRKLLHIILLGQPQLREMLSRPDLQQLAQRIIARYHLGPLSRQEVAAYVTHRLAVAGVQRQLFPAPVLDKLFRQSAGIPRLINVLCDRALLGAYVEGKDKVDRATFAKAAQEVFGATDHGPRIRRALRAAFALGLLGSAVAAAAFYYRQPQTTAIEVRQAAEPKQRAAAEPAPPPGVQPVTAKPPSEPLRWPSDLPRGRSEALAYQALFKEWKVSAAPDANGSACRAAETVGLRCLSERGGLEGLRRLNRPAVMQLHDDGGQPFFAALTALAGQAATLVVGEETRTIDIGVLALQWSGNYTVLWRKPPAYHEIIRQGSRGPAVHWLSQQLARAQARPFVPQQEPVFDAQLLRQVKEFQLAAGLLPDGVVGPQTLIHLDAAAKGESPKLLGKPRDS